MKVEKKAEQKEKAQLILESIKELFQPLKEIVKKIKDEKYEIIIADDVSARLPALVLKKVLEKISSQKIKLFFVHPLFLSQTPKIKQNFKELIDKKTLFFTEAVYSGETLIKMIRFFSRHNLSVDYAILSYELFENESDLLNYLNQRVKLNKKSKFFIAQKSSKPKIAQEQSKTLIGLVGDFESEKVQKLSKINPKNLKIYLFLFQQYCDFPLIEKIFPEIANKIKLGQNLLPTDIQKITNFVRHQINQLADLIVESLNS